MDPDSRIAGFAGPVIEVQLDVDAAVVEKFLMQHGLVPQWTFAVSSKTRSGWLRVPLVLSDAHN